MPLTVQDVLTRAGDIILDTANVRWPVAELLRYLNDARREIAILRPDVYAAAAVVSLGGGTKQALPADGSRFIDAVRNVAGDGVTPGRAVRVIEREVLDAQLPDWHTLTPAAAVEHFMFDERSPKLFFVYPPVANGTKLEIIYAKVPTEITATSATLDDEDIYAGAIVDYLCYRAFSKDAEHAANAQRAIAHYQQFANALGTGASVGAIVSPNTSNVGGTPPRVAAAAG